jgi:hypothetical protein
VTFQVLARLTPGVCFATAAVVRARYSFQRGAVVGWLRHSIREEQSPAAVAAGVAKRKPASTVSGEQSDRQLSAGASRQTGALLASSTDSDSARCRKSASRLTCPSRNQSRARARSDHGFESNGSALLDYACNSSCLVVSRVAPLPTEQKNADHAGAVP